MTLGEKIINLRSSAGLSQEEFAEKVNVSRQSVSKWEMNQALPQIDKVLLICKLFGITTDNYTGTVIRLITAWKRRGEIPS